MALYKGLSLLFSGVVLLMPMAVSAQTYTLDDGTPESPFGPSVNEDFVWLNSFTVVPGQEVITDISLSWGGTGLNTGLVGGEATSVHLWSDPNNDGNPTDALLLESVNTTIQFPNDNTFVTVDIPDQAFAAGDTFFVGGFFSNPALPFVSVAPNDENGTGPNQSWFSIGPVGSLDLNNLSGAPSFFGNIEDFGTGGNFLVRAESQAATAIPEPSTVLGTLGALGMGGLLWRARNRKAKIQG